MLQKQYYLTKFWIFLYRLTQQALELHKRKAVESAQTAADLKLHLDKYQAQLREAQVAVAEKTGAIEQEAYKYKRMQVREKRKLYKYPLYMNVHSTNTTLFLYD